MPTGIARGLSVDMVMSPDGAGTSMTNCCAGPTPQATLQCSSNVIVEGSGAVSLGDGMTIHPGLETCCMPHQPILIMGSATVYINGKGVGRLGDIYGGPGMLPHPIIKSALTVFAG